MSQDLRIIRTCRAIRNAFIELLPEKPVSKITISELCAKAEINRKTFYRHYNSIAEVSAEVENEMLDIFAHGFKDGGIDSVGSVVASVGKGIGDRREYFQRLMRHNPEVFNNGRLKEALSRMLVAVMKNRRAQSDDRALKMSAEFAVSGVFSLYAQWFENGGDWDYVNRLCVRLAENALGGL